MVTTLDDHKRPYTTLDPLLRFLSPCNASTSTHQPASHTLPDPAPSSHLQLGAEIQRPLSKREVPQSTPGEQLEVDRGTSCLERAAASGLVLWTLLVDTTGKRYWHTLLVHATGRGYWYALLVQATGGR